MAATMRPKLPTFWHILCRSRIQNRFFAQVYHPHLHRPQLPFLYRSNTRRLPTHRTQIRWLTTERKIWIKSEVRKGIKYTVVIYTFAILAFGIFFSIQQEYFERLYPTPAEWSWNSRRYYRSNKFDESCPEEFMDWAEHGNNWRVLIKRLEDANIDGGGITEVVDGGILVEGVGHTGFDVSMKSEPWRRRYYEALMGAGKAAEQLDDWVRDKVRNVAFPASSVIGPSNPRPRPLPPGSPPAPMERDCEPGFEPPETYYVKILTSKGFTDKQRMDAALAYASWLGYKNTPDAAREMLRWALDLASSNKTVFDKSGQLNSELPVSSNVLSATTAMAVFQARQDNLNMALPLFLSLLRARRSLPNPLTQQQGQQQSQQHVDESMPEEKQTSNFMQAFRLVNSTFASIFVFNPPFPPPPPDGTEIPARNDLSICQEAALMTYIGEILYATSPDQKGKEDGLAWTREAVDTSEDILRYTKVSEHETTRVCKQCLETGFDNWKAMVWKLAEHEKILKEEKKEKNQSSWLWSSKQAQDGPGRWESEAAVVDDRIERATPMLEATTTPAAKSTSMFSV